MQYIVNTILLKDGHEEWGLFLETTHETADAAGFKDLQWRIAIPFNRGAGLADRTARKPPRDNQVAYEWINIKETFAFGFQCEETDEDASVYATEVGVLGLNTKISPNRQLAAFGHRKLTSQEIIATWPHGGGLAINFYTQRTIRFANDLVDQMRLGDVALWQVRDFGPDRKDGHILAIASLVPQSIQQALLAEDQSHLSLLQAWRDSGIHERLVQAGNRLLSVDRKHAERLWKFSQTPMWASDFPDMQTSYPLVLRLDSNMGTIRGCFTIEGMDAFIDGTGPIMMAWKDPPTQWTKARPNKAARGDRTRRS